MLSGINFSLSEGRKAALIGQNGAGKSTLLKILCGLIEPDGGEVIGLENGCAYIAQDFSGNGEETPYEFLSRNVQKVTKAVRLLEDSGFDAGNSQERLYKLPCEQLSGGEQKKLEIVAGIASGATFLAIDEPENHLDYDSIEWLIEVLSQFRGGIVFVSHDQYLIDTIVELEHGETKVYSMKYEEYLSEKSRQVGGEARDWMIEEKVLVRLHTTVEMMKRRAARSSDTAATYRQTKRRYEELKESHGNRPRIETDKPRISNLSVDQKKGKTIVTVQDLIFSYGKQRVFHRANADLHFGEKAVLIGRNGTGKSTLIKLLGGELVPDSGIAAIGPNIRWQIMTQDHLAGLDPLQSALDVFRHRLPWTETQCRSYLAKYGIKTPQALLPLRELSGGQQARFKLALIFAQNPEFLILDEPTNHVDPATWEAIVEAIQGYSGTVLAITHDRSFADVIAEQVWAIEERGIVTEFGGFSEYLERRRTGRV